MALTSGSKLGPYEIQSPVGAGGMGEVYRARDARLNREVAIKVLPAAFARDPERMRRFKQEAQSVAALNHPNILAIHDFGEHEGSPYIVTEFLEGETLRERLRSGALPVRKATEIGGQVARGLAAAHEKAIVHRDLKPENILVTHDGRVKILDFGLAKLTRPDGAVPSDAATLAEQTEPGMVMGTVGYMSPEQVKGQAADHRSDLFSFGAILYEMLSGRRAFHGDTSVETMSAILKQDPPELTETNRAVPPAIERIVRHCLEKNPAERFQSARDVAFNLEVLTDTSSSSRGGVRAMPEEPSVRRWRMPLLGAVLLLASWVGIYLFAHHGTAASNPTFHEVTFRSGTIWAARFAPDGQAIVYGAAWEGQPQAIFSTRFDSSDSRSVGLSPAQILSISSKGEMAIALHPTNYAAFLQVGTLARVPLAGGAPREVIDKVFWADWTPDGQSLAVIRSGVPGYTHLEFPSGKVIYEPLGWVSHVRFSPSGEFLAIADHISGGDDGRVVIIDAHGNRRSSSSFYSSVEGLAWAPNGKEVWFSAVPAGSARSVYALDFSGKERLIYRSPGGLTIHDISRTGLVLLTADKTRISLSAVAPGETRERSLSWFDWSVITDMSADGKTIVFSETGEAVGTNYSIFLRKTDGSPAVRLGDGNTGYLSPDGQWVVSLVGSPGKLMLLPTGVGDSRQLTDDKTDHNFAAWLPDSKTIVFTATEPGHGPRTYLLDIQGGTPRTLTPEGTAGTLVTPDGKHLVASDVKHQIWLYPIAGGDPQRLNVTLGSEDFMAGLSTDGKRLLVVMPGIPAKIERVDLSTGRREPWKEIAPADPAGVQSNAGIKFSADGKSYAYSTLRILSDLYVVDGLK
jgi:eukaryotic-like serine/threonine-protein kinase